MRWLPVLLLAATAAAQNAAVHLDGGVFRVSGWTPSAEPAGGWASVFAVYAGSGEVPPMLGTYAVEDGQLVFRPRFPLNPGMHLRAVFRGEETTFEVPAAAPPAATTRVEAIYPSSGILPENALKFYIYFSAAMQRGGSYRHIALLHEDGSRVDAPFLELDQELWDPGQRRFTVLFDPGRIKRGLASLAEAGPALEAGRSYTLVVGREWRDERAAPLAAEFRKTFRVAPADRTPPDPATWRIQAPAANTRDPLIVTFPKPMDFALLQREITVEGIAGSVAVARGETEWLFTPGGSWSAGEHALIVRTALEDLAGNHILRAFDVDTFDPITPRLMAERLRVPFRIR